MTPLPNASKYREAVFFGPLLHHKLLAARLDGIVDFVKDLRVVIPR
jgi:hypothetical protein